MRGATGTGRRAIRAVLGCGAGLAMLAQPAMACEITMPACTSASNGRLASAWINPPDTDSVAMFEEYDAAGQQPEALYLAECTSRRAIRLKLPSGDGSYGATPAHDYLVEAVLSPEPRTLQQIRTGLGSLGYHANIVTLPAGHCGCELAVMETIGCGDGP